MTLIFVLYIVGCLLGAFVSKMYRDDSSGNMFFAFGLSALLMLVFGMVMGY